MTLNIRMIAEDDKPVQRTDWLKADQIVEMENRLNQIDWERGQLTNSKTLGINPQPIDARLADLAEEKRRINQRLGEDRAGRPQSITDRILDSMA